MLDKRSSELFSPSGLYLPEEVVNVDILHLLSRHQILNLSSVLVFPPGAHRLLKEDTCLTLE